MLNTTSVQVSNLDVFDDVGSRIVKNSLLQLLVVLNLLLFHFPLILVGTLSFLGLIGVAVAKYGSPYTDTSAYNGTK